MQAPSRLANQAMDRMTGQATVNLLIGGLLQVQLHAVMRRHKPQTLVETQRIVPFPVRCQLNHGAVPGSCSIDGDVKQG